MSDGRDARDDDRENLGGLVRGHLELSADDMPEARFHQMWSAIDKSLAADTPVKVSLWGTLTRWLDQKLGYIITGVASAGAVAAVALVLHGGGSSDPTENPATSFHAPAQIEALETPGGTGTVMQMEDEDGDATVIWVTADDIEGTP